MTHPKHWRRRAQGNPYAVQPLVIVTKGWRYCACYREAADEEMRYFQEWVYRQVGKTFRALPAKVIYSLLTAEEHAEPLRGAGIRGSVYYDIKWQLSNTVVAYDVTGQPIEFCNWRRLYGLFATGNPLLGNMVGRQDPGWHCEPAPDNPMEPYGPGTAALLTAGGMEMAAGHTPITYDAHGLSDFHKWRGASLHELLHALGLSHPTPEHEALYGPDVWYTPMGAFWNFPSDNRGTPARLMAHEIEQLRANNFFS